jgi:KEOPS complex subunit Cgi121
MIDYEMKTFGCTGVIKDVNDLIERVNTFAELNDIEVQLFDARLIFGSEHLQSAFEHAKRSFQKGESATHSFGMELLFYASGERQITKAIKKMGIKKDVNSIISAFIFSPHLNNHIDIIIDNFIKEFSLKKNDSLIQPDETMLSMYGISKKAVSTVQDNQIFQLILEKIALVDAIKK